MALLGTESIRQTGDSLKGDSAVKSDVEDEPAKKMYRDGVPIETISKLYKDVR